MPRGKGGSGTRYLAEPQSSATVTASNYVALAVAFINAGRCKDANGDTVMVDGRPGGFVIDRQKTPGEWSAWLVYRRHIGLSSKTIRRLGYGTVPAQWPYLFDAQWTQEQDEAACLQAGVW